MARRSSSAIPRYKRRRDVSWSRRIVGWIVKLLLAFLIASVLWVLAYRFVNPPMTITMLGDIFAGRDRVPKAQCVSTTITLAASVPSLVQP